MPMASKIARRVGKFLDLPGYDEASVAARKELDDEIARLKKSKDLTPREERRLDALMNRKMREEGAETESGMAKESKSKTLSEKEKKDLQESLEFKKGGMVKKKMMGGGYATKTAKMAKGGMANCGASMKPNGGSRNK